MSLISINPYNNQLIATYKQDANKTIHQKIDATAIAQKKWKALSITKRATYFIALQKQLQKNRNSLAELITTEMGKPITQSYLEVDKCAMVCEYYATRTTEFLQPEIIASNATKSGMDMAFSGEVFNTTLPRMPDTSVHASGISVEDVVIQIFRHYQ